MNEAQDVKPRDARSYDEWFQLMWKELVGVPTPPQLAEFKNRLWLAIREHEELSCPYCKRKFQGESMTYADVTHHFYKCKQHPARKLAQLLAELWNANVATLQDPKLRLNFRELEAKIAPELTRWGFGAAQATTPAEAEEMERDGLEPPVPNPDLPVSPNADPEVFTIPRETHIERLDDVYPNKGVVKNYGRMGPSQARYPVYTVAWEDGTTSNIKVEDVRPQGLRPV
jgi:hypothetical protein